MSHTLQQLDGLIDLLVEAVLQELETETTDKSTADRERRSFDGRSIAKFRVRPAAGEPRLV
jgi:hypothetical protein